MKKYKHLRNPTQHLDKQIKPARRFRQQVGNPLYCITCGYQIEEDNDGLSSTDEENSSPRQGSSSTSEQEDSARV